MKAIFIVIINFLVISGCGIREQKLKIPFPIDTPHQRISSFELLPDHTIVEQLPDSFTDLILPEWDGDEVPVYYRSKPWATSEKREYAIKSGKIELTESGAFDFYISLRQARLNALSLQADTTLDQNLLKLTNPIVMGIRGMSPGELQFNGNEKDRFNDTIVLLFQKEDGTKFVREFAASTDPGLVDWPEGESSYLFPTPSVTLKSASTDDSGGDNIDVNNEPTDDDDINIDDETGWSTDQIQISENMNQGSDQVDWEIDPATKVTPDKKLLSYYYRKGLHMGSYNALVMGTYNYRVREHSNGQPTYVRIGSAHNIHAARGVGTAPFNDKKAHVSNNSAGCQVIYGQRNFAEFIKAVYSLSDQKTTDYFLFDGLEVEKMVKIAGNSLTVAVPADLKKTWLEEWNTFNGLKYYPRPAKDEYQQEQWE